MTPTAMASSLRHPKTTFTWSMILLHITSRRHAAGSSTTTYG